MNLKEAETLANELIVKHGADKLGYYFAWHNKKRSAGTCSYRYKQIQLSKPITELANIIDVTDTILHEIAHALVGSGHGHDAVWVRKAKEIGCNGKRCYDLKSKPSTFEAAKSLAKYKAVCNKGHEFFKIRKPKDNRSSCGYCSNRFDPNNLLTYKLVA